MTTRILPDILYVVYQDDVRGWELLRYRPATVEWEALPSHTRERAGMTQDTTRPAWLPPERAFVVQFYADTGLDATRMAGRVEHVVSGQVSHFHSLATLLSFITRVLVARETAGETEA